MLIVDEIPKAKTLSLAELLYYQAKHKLSDLHLSSGKAPYFRSLDGDIIQLPHFVKEVAEEDLKTIFSRLLPEHEWNEYLANNETNIVLDFEKTGRFRTNVFLDQHGIGVVMRYIDQRIFTAEEYEIPRFILDLTYQSSGLILITGKNNAGKTTFLVSLLDYINSHQKKHIVVLEDPIEHILENKLSIITQRQIGTHSSNFNTAMEQVLRQDVDILVIGEMRSIESIDTALRLAETGYLVIGTLHTANIVNTIERIIDIYPPDKAPEILTILSFVLEGVVCQKLIKNLKGERTMVREYLIPNQGIRSIIRRGLLDQLENAMAVNQKGGNKLFKQALNELVQKKVIDAETMHRELEGDK